MSFFRLPQFSFCLFLATYLLGSLPICAQSITPYILNNGGGTVTNMDWSIGEGVSITPFLTGSLALNTGVLQPMANVVTGIDEFGPSVFGNQIIIGPNPVTNILHFKARITQIGNLTIQVLDAKSSIMYSYEAGTIYSIYDKDIAMYNFPPGVFYLRVYFKPTNSIAKIGVYKILKIDK